MYDSMITLIKEVPTQDEIGNTVKSEVKRIVFAEVKSVGLTEFYQAAVTGLKPEAKFLLADYLDYKEEQLLECSAYGEKEPKRYSIIRTYRKGNELELTCRREMGR